MQTIRVRQVRPRRGVSVEMTWHSNQLAIMRSEKRGRLEMGYPRHAAAASPSWQKRSTHKLLRTENPDRTASLNFLPLQKNSVRRTEIEVRQNPKSTLLTALEKETASHDRPGPPQQMQSIATVCNSPDRRRPPSPDRIALGSIWRPPATSLENRGPSGPPRRPFGRAEGSNDVPGRPVGRRSSGPEPAAADDLVPAIRISSPGTSRGW